MSGPQKVVKASQIKGERKSSILSMGSKTPVVENMQYSKYFISSKYGEWGIGWNFEFDVDLGYNLPVDYIYTNSDNLLINPQVYMEIASHSYMDIIFPFINYRYKLDINGYKYTIADYIFLLSLVDYRNYCQGISWLQTML